MQIKSATFMKSVLGTNKILADGTPQVVFIGRSNVGKSSVINSLTKQKQLAKTSPFPGRTTEINLFLINNSLYLVDLPGYGFARASWKERERIQKMMYWYLFRSEIKQKKVVLIIDASVGLTENDEYMLYNMESQKKNFVIVANKIDKIKQSEYKKKMEAVAAAVGDHTIIPYSAEKKLGVAALVDEILK
jgi:GTP-binding protein